jgi:AcrR family transcriptional regulator
MVAFAEEDPTLAFAQASAGTDVIERVATPAAAFGRALEMFRAGERIDMVAIANDLGIARTTLYRWTGDRDRLLSDLVWSELSSLLAFLVERSAGKRGIARITGVADQFLTAIADGGLQPFLAAEGERGLRLVTALEGGVRPRLVTTVAAYIEAEEEGGYYRPPDTPEVLADVLVSLGERFLHHGGDPTMNPDPDTARRAIALILREDGG